MMSIRISPSFYLSILSISILILINCCSFEILLQLNISKTSVLSDGKYYSTLIPSGASCSQVHHHHHHPRKDISHSNTVVILMVIYVYLNLIYSYPFLPSFLPSTPGTPLQNNLMELWSLMHFLMPNIFQSHKEFKDWFANPVTSMIEGEKDMNEDLINRLHGILRPFLLRRLKSEVEKQLPRKVEHIVPCKLSKRQRFLYEEFMASSGTQSTLTSGNFLGIVNVLMQLRKVCNHPDLFEVRPIVSPFDQERITYQTSSLVVRALEERPLEDVDWEFLGLKRITQWEAESTREDGNRCEQLAAKKPLIIELDGTNNNNNNTTNNNNSNTTTTTTTTKNSTSSLGKYKQAQLDNLAQLKRDILTHTSYINDLRCSSSLKPVYGYDLLSQVTLEHPIQQIHKIASTPTRHMDYSDTLLQTILLPEQRLEECKPIIESFVCIIPRARSAPISLHCSHPNPSSITQQQISHQQFISQASPLLDIYRLPFVRTQLYFPDKRLIQYDCGKLQEMAKLLRQLKSGGHRALIFTQMSRMLDVLEIFLNIHGYTYLRLDGSTKVDRRQMLMERFNKDKKIFLFILSTRSGGIGVNLTGADTVIFYDSDWNPAMDAQVRTITSIYPSICLLLPINYLCSIYSQLSSSFIYI